jgi:E3 ubiquitin-protein ligase SHPRH
VVLMSYEQLRDQLHAAAGQSSLLHQYGFWRVVLDEAQLVANSSSVAAVVASSLWRRHAWVVTGTPISQRLEEIKGGGWGGGGGGRGG